ncbi:MAG: GIY-YIG nuclease family protein [Nitrospirae bacterium]|nr:GIY-YIG nuclease family protein [Nitrospirota bacterium]MDA1303546.1 GIY-YIG nuclease family protein [Nitrospirota bacterium]
MKYVYLIRSIPHSQECYVGLTSDVEKRLAGHNAGKSHHTSKFIPWELVSFFAFTDTSKALAFERYLKTGSGRAFAKKRLW